MNFTGMEIGEILYQTLISEQWGKVIDIDEWLELILYKGGYLLIGNEIIFAYDLYKMLSGIKNNLSEFNNTTNVFDFISVFLNKRNINALFYYY